MIIRQGFYYPDLTNHRVAIPSYTALEGTGECLCGEVFRFNIDIGLNYVEDPNGGIIVCPHDEIKEKQ